MTLPLPLLAFFYLFYFDGFPYTTLNDDIVPHLRVVILHGDDPPTAGGGVVLHGGDVERLDGEGVHHTDVYSLTMT